MADLFLFKWRLQSESLKKLFFWGFLKFIPATALKYCSSGTAMQPMVVGFHLCLTGVTWNTR